MLYAQAMQADGASYRNILLTHAPGTESFRPITGAGVVSARPAETPFAGHEFPEATILRRLIALGLSRTSPLSALAVELLPYDTTGDTGSLDAVGSTTLDTQTADPLGAQLGTRRILRTSPLTALPSVC
jgi:hypothetical protein